jgi:hypothetical protein
MGEIILQRCIYTMFGHASWKIKAYNVWFPFMPLIW